jgi:hypothetical protein
MQKTATSPGSNFNRQGGSVFNQRQHDQLGVGGDAIFMLIGIRLQMLLMLIGMSLAVTASAF